MSVTKEALTIEVMIAFGKKLYRFIFENYQNEASFTVFYCIYCIIF
jgi:hypothetical protein